jgi:hypothetical protein
MKKVLSLMLLLAASTGLWAQKGQVWPSETRQEFEIDENGKITKEYAAGDYNSYYLFINNNEFIHCTGTITSLYKIVNRKQRDGGVEYSVVSEVGNNYQMFFHEKDKYIVLSSRDKGFSVYIECKAPYTTQVFDNINR